MLHMLALGALIALVCLVAVSGVQTIGPSEYRRRLRSYLSTWDVPHIINFTGTTAASATVTVVTNIGNLRIGQVVTGGGFPAGTTVVAINSTTDQITLSNATAGTGTLVPLVASGPTASPLIHLAAAPMSPGGDPTPADFTEASFDSYSSLPFTGTAVYSNTDGSAESDFGPISWVLLATPVTSNIIYGYWIDYLDPMDGTTRVVSVWEAFPMPINMNAAGQAVVVTPPMKAPLPGSAVLP